MISINSGQIYFHYNFDYWPALSPLCSANLLVIFLLRCLASFINGVPLFASCCLSIIRFLLNVMICFYTKGKVMNENWKLHGPSAQASQTCHYMTLIGKWWLWCLWAKSAHSTPSSNAPSLMVTRVRFTCPPPVAPLWLDYGIFVAVFDHLDICHTKLWHSHYDIGIPCNLR